MTRIWQCIAAASIGANLASMVMQRSAVSIVAGLVACFIAPVVIYLQVRLQDTNNHRKLNTQMAHYTSPFLTELTHLDTQVGRLTSVEANLDTITKVKGIIVDTFIQLVKDNPETIEQLKNCCARSQSAVKADLTQTLFTDCIESDFDSSGTFSDQEIQILEVRMQNLPGIQVNHGLLVAKGSDCKLESLLALLTPLDRTDLSDDRRIFRFDEDHLPQPPKLS